MRGTLAIASLASGPRLAGLALGALSVLGVLQAGFGARSVEGAPGFDVAVTSLFVTASGSSVTVVETTRNEGDLGVGSTVTKFYLSADTMLDGADLLVGARVVPPLEGGTGATSSAATTLPIPAAVPAGRYFILAWADADLVFAESNEANNIAATAEPIRIDSDMVAWLDVPSESSTPAAGATIAVTDFTRNDGLRPVPPSTTVFYLSATPTFDAGER